LNPGFKGSRFQQRTRQGKFAPKAFSKNGDEYRSLCEALFIPVFMAGIPLIKPGSCLYHTGGLLDLNLFFL